MNPDPMSDAPEATLSSATAGPGRVIRQARERAKLGIEELATMTRLARATLEALERDDFSTLTEAVYVRGYYRKCAKVLNLPEAELIAAYDKLYAPKSAPMPTKLLLGNSGSTMGSGRSSGGGSGWVIVLVIAGLIGAGAWFLTHDEEVLPVSAAAVATPPAAPAIPASALTAPAASDPALAAPSDATAGASTELPAPALTAVPGSAAAGDTGAATAPASPAGVALTSSSTLSVPPSSEAAAVTTSATPAGADGNPLVLDFKSASWVRIEDADGRTLLSGTIQSGDHQVLRGREPYSLFIGYAPGVNVEFAGKPFDLSPHIRQNSTARINLPYVPAPQ